MNIEASYGGKVAVKRTHIPAPNFTLFAVTAVERANRVIIPRCRQQKVSQACVWLDPSPFLFVHWQIGHPHVPVYAGFSVWLPPNLHLARFGWDIVVGCC